MEKKKMKLSLKKETVEVLNRNDMSGVYGGAVVSLDCTGYNTREGTCSGIYQTMQADGCADSLACVGTGTRFLCNDVIERVDEDFYLQHCTCICDDPCVPLTQECIPMMKTDACI